jgi:hypothetical protein
VLSIVPITAVSTLTATAGGGYAAFLGDLNKLRQEANDAGIAADAAYQQTMATHAGYAAAIAANAHALALWGLALASAQQLTSDTGKAAVEEARRAVAGLLLQKDALGAASKLPGASGAPWWPLGLAAALGYFLWRRFRR